MESMPSCELHQWSLPEDKYNFWQIFVPSNFFIIPISLLVMLQLLRWCWHREDETEQNQTELQMISQDGESFIQQLRAMPALMQEAKDKQCAQIQNEMESVKETMKVNERHLAQFQNMMDLVKMIKAGDGHLAQLQNQMGLTEEAI
jgi:hypothetical protein